MGITARLCPFTLSCVQRFLISGQDLRITARLCQFTLSCVQRFLISGGQFKNRCKVMPVYALLCAAIPDFRGSIWESLQGYCPFTPLACSDSLFEGVNLGIAARLCPFTPSCLQRFLISGGKLGNHCKVMPIYDLLRAAILDFRPRLANRCSGEKFRLQWS